MAAFILEPSVLTATFALTSVTTSVELRLGTSVEADHRASGDLTSMCTVPAGSPHTRYHPRGRSVASFVRLAFVS